MWVNRSGGSFVLYGMSTSKTTLVASALAMTLAASVVAANSAIAANPVDAAPPPPLADPVEPTKPGKPVKPRGQEATLPNQVSLKKKDVGHLGLDTLSDSGVTDTGMATFSGQYCDTTDNGATGNEPLPTLGRWWFWFEDATTLGVSVDHVVTSWADAPGALADIQNDTGQCRVGSLELPNYTVQVADDDEFVATWDNAAVAAQLVGNNIVAITVDDWNDRIDELAEAQRLLDIAVANAAKSKKLP